MRTGERPIRAITDTWAGRAPCARLAGVTEYLKNFFLSFFFFIPSAQDRPESRRESESRQQPTHRTVSIKTTENAPNNTTPFLYYSHQSFGINIKFAKKRGSTCSCCLGGGRSCNVSVLDKAVPGQNWRSAPAPATADRYRSHRETTSLLCRSSPTVHGLFEPRSFSGVREISLPEGSREINAWTVIRRSAAARSYVCSRL